MAWLNRWIIKFRRMELASDFKLLQQELKQASAQDVLVRVLAEFGNRIVLASSLGAEDQVLTHMAFSINPDVRVFVLDTGRLHSETYDVIAETQSKLGVKYEIYFPDAKSVEDMVNEKGINLFYASVENRKTCCGIRKVEPLRRALSSADAWITGLRRSQSVTRAKLDTVEWDDAHNMLKVNPLADWSEDDVWQYIKLNSVPYNALHDVGFPSIGCAPCTRAIAPGEDVRAGRWWWEDPANKECGLHVVDGKLVRAKSGDSKEVFE